MTKEELKQESQEYAEGMAKYYASTHEDCIPSQFEKYMRNAYISSAEPREKQIANLEDKLANADFQLEGRDNEIRELKAQIKKMKCCDNCENGELSAHEEPCRHCQRCFASKDVTDQENVKDNWELIKEIKEND